MTPQVDSKQNVSRWKIILLLIFPLFVSACYYAESARNLRAAIRSLPEQRWTPPPVEAYRDVRGAIHVHSYLSHDSRGQLDEIIGAAIQDGLQFIVMTDHATPRIFTEGLEGWQQGVLVVRGMEIIQERASLLAIGMTDYFDYRQMPLQEVVNRVKKQGGLIFAAHPRTYPGWQKLTGLDGMEIYDILDDATDHKTRYPRYLFEILFAFDRYPDEVFLSILDRPEEELNQWDHTLQSRKMVGIAGNDAHQNVRILGRQIDPYSRSLGFVNTHLFVQTLDQKSLLEALAAGRGYVSFDLLSDATGFFFGARDNEHVWQMGEEIPFQKGIQIISRSPQPGKAQLIKDGVVIQQTEGTMLSFYPKESGVYRVEWSLRLGDGWWPWIFSNPIYIG